MPMMNEPWYEIVPAEDRLTQGDVVLDCPLLAPSEKAWRRACDDIANGYVWNQAFLNGWHDGGLATEHRIVEFHEVHTLPRAFLESILTQRKQPRFRLRPPYREHLSQAFARFFMRVGLPTPLDRVW
jgi:hypothetical protein